MATATPDVRQSWEQAGVAPNPWGVALMKAFREGFLEEMISEKKNTSDKYGLTLQKNEEMKGILGKGRSMCKDSKS